MVNFLQNMPPLATGGCCRIGREYRLTRRYTGCVLARKVNGCPACRMHTGVLSHRETSGWTALVGDSPAGCQVRPTADAVAATRSEEHTSELQSRGHLVCRLLL